MTTDETETNRPTHSWVANKIGYSIAGVSLLRSGNRQPTLDTMEKIQEAFGWPIGEQASLREDYAVHLNQMLVVKYIEELKETKGEDLI